MKLYHYEHCPYCVKARMIFGLKDVSMTLQALANDDEETPIGLVGQKMVPILIKEDGTAMPESLDIVKYIDERYGNAVIVNYENSRVEIAQWLQDSRNYTYHLAMPRWVKMELPEFATESAKQYFQEKKERLNIGPFTEAIANTDKYKKLAEDSLQKLAALLDSKNQFYDLGDQVHVDDFHVFATLRSLTCVKGLQWPPALKEYVDQMAERSKIFLFDEQAI